MAGLFYSPIKSSKVKAIACLIKYASNRLITNIEPIWNLFPHQVIITICDRDSTVYWHYKQWREQGVIEEIMETLHHRLREQVKKKPK